MTSLSFTEITYPIELEYAGISVSIPSGILWESDEQWQYGENSYYLTSRLRSSEGNPLGSVLCRFLLESMPLTSEELILQKNSSFSGEITRKGIAMHNGFTIQWANIKIPASPYEVYYGVSKLESNHLLEIEVQKIDAAFRGGEIFEGILRSINQEQNSAIQAGTDILREFKDRGIGSTLDSIDYPSAYLFIDSKNRPMGFLLDVFSHSDSDDPLMFSAEGLHYIRPPFSQWRSTSFYGDENMTEYIWRCQELSSFGKGEVRAALDKDGTVTLTKLTVPPAEKKYAPSLLYVPEVFSDALVSYIQQSQREQVHIEIVEPSGKITPMAVFKIEPEIIKPDSERPAYALQINYLDDSGMSQKIYFDDEGKTIRQLLILPAPRRDFRRNSEDRIILTLVRSTAENLVEQFPDQAELILEKISKANAN
ncbi:MAG: hypothetical protein ACYTE8_08075 [Planctomycetota bacterium]